MEFIIGAKTLLRRVIADEPQGARSLLERRFDRCFGKEKNRKKKNPS